MRDLREQQSKCSILILVLWIYSIPHRGVHGSPRSKIQDPSWPCGLEPLGVTRYNVRSRRDPCKYFVCQRLRQISAKEEEWTYITRYCEPGHFYSRFTEQCELVERNPTACSGSREPEQPGQIGKRIIACHNQEAVLDCGYNATIRVKSAFYGRRDDHVCGDHNFHSQDCRSPRAFQAVSLKCAGKYRCSVVAWSNVFGEYCPNMTPAEQSMEYVEINYLCQDNGCLPGWKMNHANQQCYGYFNNPVNFEDGERVCQPKTTYTNRIASLAENQFLFNWLNNLVIDPQYQVEDGETKAVWLPINVAQRKWTNDVPLTWDNFEQTMVPRPGERMCAIMPTHPSSHGGFWQQKSCDSHNSVVCTVHNSLRCPNNWTLNYGNERCYKYFPLRLAWRTALTRCQSLGYGSRLALPFSEPENEFLLKIVNNPDVPFGATEVDPGIWLNGNDVEQRRHWVWGEDSTYTNWKAGEPSQQHQYNGNCAAMRVRFNGKWADEDCRHLGLRYVCERPIRQKLQNIVVCYVYLNAGKFCAWKGRCFTMDDVPTDICNHIVFADYGSLSLTNWTLHTQVNTLKQKNPQIKFQISVDFKDPEFRTQTGQLTLESVDRTVIAMVAMLRRDDLDGVCIEANQVTGFPEPLDNPGYLDHLWLEEIIHSFFGQFLWSTDGKPLFLALAVSGVYEDLHNYPNWEDHLMKVDMVYVFAFGYYKPHCHARFWRCSFGSQTALHNPNPQHVDRSVSRSVEAWLSPRLGIPRDKLVLILTTRPSAWLVHNFERDPPDEGPAPFHHTRSNYVYPSTGSFSQKRVNNDSDIITTQEICKYLTFLKYNFPHVVVNKTCNQDYCQHKIKWGVTNRWWLFIYTESKATMEAKADYILEQRLAGVGFHTLQTADWNNRCANTAHGRYARLKWMAMRLLWRWRSLNPSIYRAVSGAEAMYASTCTIMCVVSLVYMTFIWLH